MNEQDVHKQVRYRLEVQERDGVWDLARSFSERLAHHFVEKAIRGADAYIDMHGGDLPEALVPFNIFYETGDAKVDAASRGMAEVFGAPALMVQRSEGAPVSGLAYATAALLGVPAFIAEGHLARHVRRMRKVYAERRTSLLDALQEHCCDLLDPVPASAGLRGRGCPVGCPLAYRGALGMIRPAVCLSAMGA